MIVAVSSGWTPGSRVTTTAQQSFLDPRDTVVGP
jgi:hypothetical protein